MLRFGSLLYSDLPIKIQFLLVITTQLMYEIIIIGAFKLSKRGRKNKTITYRIGNIFISFILLAGLPQNTKPTKNDLHFIGISDKLQYFNLYFTNLI